jgi:4-diphosphocytidyl-2-C-methyl-D-erythritol kinase
MITLTAPAKINWFLKVIAKRDDGYHEIRSLMQCISLFDKLFFEHAERITVITDTHIPLEGNLVYRAARMLQEISGTSRGVKITLKKEIPLAAGLGGGSSDAAITLIGLNRFWKLNLSVDELSGLGTRLGSDVPFFFRGPAAIVEGRGEIVKPVHVPSYILVLVKPPFDVSTAWAYREIDETDESPMRNGVLLTKEDNSFRLLLHALEKGDFSSLSSLLRNDFEPYVIRRFPVVGEIKKNLLRSGALFSSMSGSGPTVFGVFGEFRDAEKASERMIPHWSKTVHTLAEKKCESICDS